jgi:DNA-binding IclR family transcriptional regulator
MVRREKSEYVIQSVSHALDLMEQFCRGGDEIGVTELSKRLKLHKNNVFRLLATLESHGYVEQNKATENYRLGLKCLQLGHTYAEQTGFLPQARAVLRELARACGESCFVAVRRGAAVVPLEFVEGDNSVRVVSLLGTLMPLYCTAAGRICLAFDGDGEVRDGLTEKLERFTDKTVVDRHRIADAVKEVGTAGYAVEHGEFMDDLASVAVPIQDYTRALVGTLGVAGPSYRMTEEHVRKQIVPLLLKSGSDLSRRLGFPG